MVATVWSAVAGSPGPLLAKTPSGATASTSSAVAVLGSTCTSRPRSAIIRGVLVLMPRSRAATRSGRAPAVVDGRRDDVGLRRGDLLGQRGPGHLGRGEHALEQPGRVGLGGGDADAHGAALAQVAGQRAGVDAADADHALLAQVVVEGADRPPAARHPGRVAHDVPADPDATRLGVVVVHAGVADVRSGHHHDLPVVRRVGERLLVAAHAGVEHRLAEGLPLGAVGVPVEGAAVLEDEDRGCARDSRVVPPSPPHRTDR